MSGADAPARSFPWRACDRCEQSDQCKSDSRTCADQAGSVNDFYARDMDAIVTQSTTSQTCAQCADCGLSYSDPSWVDMVLPHDEWVKLDPTVTAILCMNCMAKRAAKAGFTPTVEGLYGALSLATAQPATSQEGDMLPCPFCGVANLLSIERVPRPVRQGFLHVRCRGCGCISGGRGGDTELEAITQWNKRSDLPRILHDASTRKIDPKSRSMVGDALWSSTGRNWTDDEIDAFILAATPTPPTLSEDLREVLEFYADRDSDGYRVDVTNYGLSTEEGEIVRDGGARARAALNARGGA